MMQSDVDAESATISESRLKLEEDIIKVSILMIQISLIIHNYAS